MISAQWRLNWDYPKEQRGSITRLVISRRDLKRSLDLSDFPYLTYLDCSYNQLTSLNLANCPNLIELHCEYNQLTQLNLTNNTQLTKLDCSQNQLTELILSVDNQLTSLNCRGNQLTHLNLPYQIQLIYLNCSQNKLTTLNLANCPQLTELNCSSNQLTQLNLTNNKLTRVFCSSNQLTILSLSNCPNLTNLHCASNQLTDLILSPNNQLRFLDCSSNPFPNFDWLLALNPSCLDDLKLNYVFESGLKSYLQPRETIGMNYPSGIFFMGEEPTIKWTYQLASNEVNYVTLLARWQVATGKWLEKGFFLVEMRQWMSWMSLVGFQSGEIDSNLIFYLQSQGYTPHRLEAELAQQKKPLEVRIVVKKEEGLLHILDVAWTTLLVRWKEVNQQLINNWVVFYQFQANQQLTNSNQATSFQTQIQQANY